MTWVRTDALREALPLGTMTVNEIAALTGEQHKTVDRIRSGETEFTDFYVADRLLAPLGRVTELNSLEEFERRRPEHGITAYQHGCRCAVCRQANADKGRRQRRQRRETA